MLSLTNFVPVILKYVDVWNVWASQLLDIEMTSREKYSSGENSRQRLSPGIILDCAWWDWWNTGKHVRMTLWAYNKTY